MTKERKKRPGHPELFPMSVVKFPGLRGHISCVQAKVDLYTLVMGAM